MSLPKSDLKIKSRPLQNGPVNGDSADRIRYAKKHAVQYFEAIKNLRADPSYMQLSASTRSCIDEIVGDMEDRFSPAMGTDPRQISIDLSQ